MSDHDHEASCEFREKLGGCTCGQAARAIAEGKYGAIHAPGCEALIEPPKIVEPTAADLPDGEYAIAEIMGHSTMIGRFAEVERFGTKMLAIEPIWQNKLLPAVFVGGSSLYRFTPCSREVAFKRQPRFNSQLPDAVRATLPDEPRLALERYNSIQAEYVEEHEDQDHG